MSSFICSSKHYNSIEKKLIYELVDKGNKELNLPHSLLKHLPNFRTNETFAREYIREMVDTIRNLNVLCVSLQYKDHYKGTLDREIKEQSEIVMNRNESKDISVLGLYNAMRCTCYQIETEHLKELRNFSTIEAQAMEFLNEMIDQLAHHIVSQMPEDKTNCWSIE